MVRWRLKHTIFLVEGIIILIFVIILLITRVFMTIKASWWWCFGFLIIFEVIGLIILLIYLATKKEKAKETREKLSEKEAKAMAVNKVVYDDHYPDNPIFISEIPIKVGERGNPRTPLRIFHGYGSELGNTRDVVANLAELKGEMASLVDATDEEVVRVVFRMAEYPEEEIITEEVLGTDIYGRTLQKVKTRRIHPRQIEKEKEEKEAEEAGGI